MSTAGAEKTIEGDEVRCRVVVAGASGFIGTEVLPRLAERFDVTALTRSPARASTPADEPNVAWRHCDLFSVDSLREALAGARYGVYLVHSLARSSRLTQARPRDMDLMLADNFARAAAAAGLKHIVFVSAVMPSGYRFAPLTWNRREVEMVLASRGTPLTALRASLVVGPGGTGPRLLLELVRRLPVLLLPAAARSRTRPIAVQDLARAIVHCLGRPEAYAGAHDIGGPDVLSYEAMLRQAAAAQGRRRWFLRVPFLPLGLTAAVARVVSDAPAPVVGAVVESLPEDLVLRESPVQDAIEPDARPFEAALAASIDPQTGRLLPNPRSRIRRWDDHVMRGQALVRSVQRIILPPGQDAAWVAGNYFRWVGRFARPIVRSEVSTDGRVTIWLFARRCELLTLTFDAEHSSPERCVFAITGGLLARGQAAGFPRFEFQTLLQERYTMMAIHDYAPAIPWYVYSATQAVAHLLVMKRYQAKLARLAR